MLGPTSIFISILRDSLGKEVTELVTVYPPLPPLSSRPPPQTQPHYSTRPCVCPWGGPALFGQINVPYIPVQRELPRVSDLWSTSVCVDISLSRPLGAVLTGADPNHGKYWSLVWYPNNGWMLVDCG